MSFLRQAACRLELQNSKQMKARPSRRRSSILKTAPILGLRLEIQNFTSSLDDSMEVDTLITELKAQQFMQSLNPFNLDSLRMKYRANRVSLGEIEDLLFSLIPNDLGPSVSTMKTSTDSSLNLVDKQKMALSVDISPVINSINVGIMDFDDPRITLAPENKLVVSSSADIGSAVHEYCSEKCIQSEDHISVLFDYVERVALKACQKELRLLEEAIEDYRGQVKTMAGMTLASEEAMVAAIKDLQQQSFVNSVMKSGHRRGSVVRDVQSFLGGGLGGGSAATSDGGTDADSTPSRLAMKLHSLQSRALVAEKELKHFLEMEQLYGSDPDAVIPAPPQETISSRQEWRKKVDSDLSKRRMDNDRRCEHNRLIKNISLAAGACGDPSGQITSLIREEISTSRQKKLDRISELRTALAAIDAETHSLSMIL